MKDLADIISENKKAREARVRQGKVTSIQAGPPRTLTVNIGGTDYAGIRCMDHVNPTVAEGVWILDMGIGRWIAFGNSSATPTRTEFVKLSGDTMTASLGVQGNVNLFGNGFLIQWLDATGATSHGYMQGNATQIVIQESEATGSLAIGTRGVTNLLIAGQTFTFTGTALLVEVIRGWTTLYRDTGTFATDWTQTVLNVRNTGAAGTHRTAGISFLQTAAYAPQLYAGEDFGERLEVITTAGSAHAAIAASAFTVVSSERIKKDIEPVSVLDQLTRLQTKKYRLRARPGNLRLAERFANADSRWQAKGRQPLTPKDSHWEVHDHECAIDGCFGTADHPCNVTRNDTPQFGLIAEDVYEVFPEVVNLDWELKPESIDINQLVAIAIGGLKELTERVAALEAT